MPLFWSPENFHQPPALNPFHVSLFCGLLETLAPIYHGWVVKVLHTEGLQTWDYNHRSSHHQAVVCLFSLVYSESMNSLSPKHRKVSVERWKYWQSRCLTTRTLREWWFVCFHSYIALWRVSNAGHMLVPNDKLNPCTTSSTRSAERHTEPRTKYNKRQMKKRHKESSIGYHPMHGNKNGRSMAVRFVVRNTGPITLSKPVVHAQRNY